LHTIILEGTIEENCRTSPELLYRTNFFFIKKIIIICI
jgi:hypothetical protein